MDTATILPIAQLVLAVCNIIIIAYGGYKFINKPHDNLKERVDAHDVEIKEIKASLKMGNDRFREQDNTNEVLIRSTLALVEFEIQYCLTEKKPMSEDLKKAKEDLHDYLSKK